MQAARFTDHIDEEEGPDEATTNFMADNMFDEMDKAPRYIEV